MLASNGFDKSEGLEGSNSMELEETFVWPEGTRPNVVHDKFDFDLPVLDLSPVLKLEQLREEVAQWHGQGNNLRRGLQAEIHACEAATADIKKTIREACQEYGFFQIINHDLPVQLVEQLSDCFRQLFALPLTRGEKFMRRVHKQEELVI